MYVFDRKLYKSKLNSIGKNFKQHSFLHEESSEFLYDILSNLKRTFDKCFVYGYAPKLLELKNYQDIVKANISKSLSLGGWSIDMELDEEDMALPANEFDLIISNLSLQYVNNLPKALSCYQRFLKSKGLFIATLLGGESLLELRQACANADLRLYGGISPRVAPMVSLESASQLMQKCNFEMPVSHSFTVTLEHSNFLKFIKDLHGAGFGNFLYKRSKQPPCKAFLTTLSKEYEKLCHKNGKIQTKLEILVMTGSKS